MIKHVTLPDLRLHLREVKDGSILWINGNQAVHLNPVATSFIIAFIDSMNKSGSNTDFLPERVKDDIISKLRKKYSMPKDVIIKDFDKVYGQIITIGKGDACVFSEGSQIKDLSAIWEIAPARADLALTYRCNDKCSFCYVGERKMEELNTEYWKKIINELWKIGIPSVIFTGGEPTLRTDLVELVGSAKEFVTGVITNGRNLSPELCSELYKAQLDYVQVSIESADSGIHDRMVGVEGAWQETVAGIRHALKSKIIVTTNTTLTRLNINGFKNTIKLIQSLGVTNIACNSLICSGSGCMAIKDSGLNEDELQAALIDAKEYAITLGIDLQWYSPTCYLRLNPIDLGFGIKSCSAAKYNVTIEPNGDVIPCQSWFEQKMGNILKDNWTAIWDGAYAKSIRDGKFVPENCSNCEFMPTCNGACHLSRPPSEIRST
jgi:radical SAM protein with 4Fe4S-binding SPASM domain